jgi:integrase
MAIFKRGDVWWLDIATPSGTRIRHSCQTADRKAAQQYHDQLRVDLWRQAKLGEKPKRSWEEAALRWLKENAHKASLRDDAQKIGFLTPHFQGALLSDLTWDRIQGVVEGSKGSATPSTRNRYYALVRSILRRAAREWGWLDAAPTIKLHKEPEGRVRFLTAPQIDALLRTLPTHLSEITSFSLATGLRMGNVIALKWEQVDLTRRSVRIQGMEVKTRLSLGLPLNHTAMEIIRRQIGKHSEFVFTYDGHPVTSANTRAWRAALKKVGIENFRFHDVRHTWASLLIQNGVPKAMIKELGGWKSEKMVERYAHLATEHLAPYAAVIDQLLIPKPGLKRKSREH